jgi:hypothetical protein
MATCCHKNHVMNKNYDISKAQTAILQTLCNLNGKTNFHISDAQREAIHS